MINITDKDNCTGCRSCELACPKNCIQMSPDDEGFLYPTVDKSNCIDCGLCDKICHMQKESDSTKDFGGEIFVGINNNESERLTSSSGGIFSLLAKRVFSLGGVVYGVGFDSDFNVIHKRCDSISSIGELRGSKYVQSDLSDTFALAKKDLTNGIVVLFTGTPCQIGALKSYLGKEYENLYTQSFICHGVPSPLVWRKFVDYVSSSENKKIKKISFRDKTYGWKRFSMKIVFEDDTSIVKTLDKDIYLQLFLKNTCLRPSCHDCHYKTFEAHSLSDITLADWWGMPQGILPPAEDDKGASIIIANTPKGKQLLDSVNDDITLASASYEQTVSRNSAYSYSVPITILFA